MARNADEEGAASEIFYDAPVAKVISSEEKRFRLKELEKSFEEQHKKITEAVDLKLKESSDKLAQQIIAELKLKESSDKLAQQKAEQENARLNAEIMSLSAQVKSYDDELNKIKLQLLENENQRQQLHQVVKSLMDAKEFNHEGVSSSPSSHEVKNIVLVGRTCNGKSATGNSILGRKALKSMFRTTGRVTTRTCEKHTTVLENGQTLAVIDTPAGLFDSSAEPEFIHNEMLKCMDMAKDRIHAILLTMSSISNRFSREEEAGLLMLQNFFGPKIMDYMIIVFTCGDQLEEFGMTLDDYLSGTDCPDLLKETLRKCGNRAVLFNNKTKDEAKKSEQLKQLQTLLDTISDKNGGKPYTHAVVDTNGGKQHTHAGVDTNGGKPHTTIVDTNGGKPYTKEPLLEPKKVVMSAFHHFTSDITAHKGATNKPHDRIAKVSSFKKEEDIVELMGDQPVRKLHIEGQLENIARLKAENKMLLDQLESGKEKLMLLIREIEAAKRKNDQNLQSQDGVVTRAISKVSRILNPSSTSST